MTPTEFRHITLSLSLSLVITHMAYQLQELITGLQSNAIMQLSTALLLSVYVSKFIEHRKVDR